MRVWGWLVGLGCGVIACSGQQQPAPGQVQESPRQAAKPGAAKPEREEAGENVGEAFSLERFTPLLALPELAKVAQAIEEEQHAAAARLLEAGMAEQSLSPEAVLRWQFLLARVREDAGELEGAAASYDLAAQRSWPLSDYALLGASRIELRRGRADRALARLTKIDKQGAIAARALTLQAEAASVVGNYDVAIEAWQKHLAGDSPSQPGLSALRLSQALLKRYQAKLEEPKSSSQQAAQAAPAAKSASTTSEPDADLLLALQHARHAENEFANDAKSRAHASATVREVLEMMPAEARQRYSTPRAEEELARLVALVEARQEKLALEVAENLLSGLPKAQRFGATACEARLQKAKALSLAREYGRAADFLSDAITRCKGEADFRARLLYLGGKYARFDSRHMQAIQRFEQLEREAPEHRLADDARLYRAQSYFTLGVEARFTELLSNMPRDYPHGDMVMDGVFELALRRIHKSDWSGAASVLELGKQLTEGHDSARGQEHSGRERYFLARAWEAMNHSERARAEYEAIVVELPLSYYMLHAYSRLKQVDPKRAQQALQRAKQLSETQPFAFEARPEFSTPEFVRGMELLKQGEVSMAREELATLGLFSRGADSKLLWAIALLYARAGAAKLSHQVAKGLLTDWLGRWPAGQWVQAWELAFPRPYLSIVEREAKKNGLEQAWIYGVMREESEFDASAVSHANAYGLMQLIKPTAKMFAKPLGLPYDTRSLKTPRVNIALGARALSSLTTRFKSNPLLALPGYNAGPGRPVRWVKERPHFDFDVWVELIPFRETRRYTKRVLASRAAYAVLYEPEFAERAMTLPLKVSP